MEEYLFKNKRKTMNSIVHRQNSNNPLVNQHEMSKVLTELDDLKRQSERLDLMNQLHGRMAGVLSVNGMIEAYSVWLMPHVAHELIGYNNQARNKKHLFCSGHGPYRRKAVAYAEELLAAANARNGCYSKNGQYAHKWFFETSEDSGILLILKDDRELNSEELELINDSLLILSSCLQRGLEYEDLFEKASHDSLTGLANRRSFEERIGGMMHSAKRYGHPLTMVSMDLDHFKSINDTYGHLAGDEALKAVADVLCRTIRSSDLLVRMGGDEFILVLDNTDIKNARFLAERLCAAVTNLQIQAGNGAILGVSIGLSQMEQNESLDEWLERTDDILYHAKDKGRGRVESC